mgnify:CR=1 FL=1
MGNVFKKPLVERYEENAAAHLDALEYARAYTLYNSALDMKLRKPKRYAKRIGQSYLMLAYILLVQEQSIDLVITHLEKCITFFKQSFKNKVKQTEAKRFKAMAYFLLGTCYLGQEDFEEAHRYMEKSYKKRLKYIGAQDPETVMSMCGIAKIYRVEKNYEDALSFYNMAEKILLRRPPDDFRLDLMMYKQKCGRRVTSLEKRLNEAIFSLYPDASLVRFNIGEILMHMNRRHEALICFEGALQYLVSHKRSYGPIYQRSFDSMVNQIRGIYYAFPLMESPIEDMLKQYSILPLQPEPVTTTGTTEVKEIVQPVQSRVTETQKIQPVQPTVREVQRVQASQAMMGVQGVQTAQPKVMEIQRIQPVQPTVTEVQRVQANQAKMMEVQRAQGVQPKVTEIQRIQVSQPKMMKIQGVQVVQPNSMDFHKVQTVQPKLMEIPRVQVVQTSNTNLNPMVS